ncbi:MAG: ABC transporter permease [Acidobacteriota bacterium]
MRERTGAGRDGGGRAEWGLTAPSLLWLAAFFAVPTLLVTAYSFRPPDPYGGLGEGWTLDTWRRLQDPAYRQVAWRTLWLSVAATVICLGLALPAAYAMARSHPSWRRIWLLLVIIPFWTNFLIRVFAWKVLLHPDGWAKWLLTSAGIADPETLLLYRPEAVLLVLVYTYLPFAILPIFAAAEKFDFQLLEAAQDLGASRIRSLWSVFLPGIRRGLLTAALVVFIPALGSYVIPDILGGTSSEMIGNKIAQRVFVDRNLPEASALSATLVLAVVLPMLVVLAVQLRSRPPAAGHLPTEGP